VPFVRIDPKTKAGNGTVVIWLSARGSDGLVEEGGQLTAAAQKLIDGGVTIVCPMLYLSGAKEQPMNPPKSKDPKRDEWQWTSAYTYGYNPTLVAHRVHDAMTVLAGLQSSENVRPAKIIIAGRYQGGVVAAVAAAMSKSALSGAVIDTGGFRFASLDDQWNPMFVPGAVKYGDVPALLKLSESLKPTVLGENGVKGGIDEVVAAVLKQAAQGARVSAN
jgi:dienelactone hydrolase